MSTQDSISFKVSISYYVTRPRLRLDFRTSSYDASLTVGMLYQDEDGISGENISQILEKERQSVQ